MLHTLRTVPSDERPAVSSLDPYASESRPGQSPGGSTCLILGIVSTHQIERGLTITFSFRHLWMGVIESGLESEVQVADGPKSPRPSLTHAQLINTSRDCYARSGRLRYLYSVRPPLIQRSS
jgi:hypothetical protein